MARAHAKSRSSRPPRRPSHDEELIARAEAAMADLSSHFAGWMQDECRRLEGLSQRLAEQPADAAMLEQLYRAAHDIKGEAATFGYPVVERIITSLCRLMSRAPDRSRIPFPLIELHVSAVRKAVEIDRDGEALAGELESATAAFLRETMK